MLPPGWRPAWRVTPGYRSRARVNGCARERLTVRDVARALEVSPVTVRRLIANGWLTASAPKPWQPHYLIRPRALRRALRDPLVVMALEKARARMAGRRWANPERALRMGDVREEDLAPPPSSAAENPAEPPAANPIDASNEPSCDE